MNIMCLLKKKRKREEWLLECVVEIEEISPGNIKLINW